MNIASLFVTLGIKADMAALKAFGSGIQNISKNMLALQAGASTALYGLDKFLAGSIKNSTALSNFNQQTGLSIEKLQQWQKAASAVNLDLSSNAVQTSISNLSKRLGPDTFQFLEGLREVVSGLDASLATSLVQSLGLDAGFVSVLKLTRDEFDKLSNHRLLNRNQIDNINRLGQSITGLKDSLSVLKDQAVSQISPALNNLIGQFQTWVNLNYDKITDTFTFLTNSASNFIGAVGKVSSALGGFVSDLLGWDNSIKGTVLVSLLGLAAAFPGTALAVAGIGAVEDIINGVKGKDSISGRAYNWATDKANMLFGVGQYSKENVMLYDIMKNAIRDALNPPENILDYVGAPNTILSYTRERSESGQVITINQNINSSASAISLAAYAAGEMGAALRRIKTNNSVR